MTTRLLYVANDAAYLWRNYGHVIARAVSEGYSVGVAAPFPYDARGINAIPSVERFEILLDRRSMNPLRECSTVASLRALYRRWKPQIVHHFTVKPVLYGTFSAFREQVPTVVNSITGLGYLFTAPQPLREPLKLMGQVLYRALLQHPHMHFLVQNEADRAHLLGCLAGQTISVHSIAGAGIDPRTSPPLPLPEGPCEALFAGRLLREKGVPELIAAAQELEQRRIALKIHVCGEVDRGNRGALRASELNALASMANIELHGHVPNLGPLLARTHVAVLPSHREGRSRFLVEALAAGRAIVTTQAPGGPEVCHDRVNGILVPIKNPQLLANALGELALSPQLQQTYGAASRKLFETGGYDQTSVQTTVLSLYR